MMSEKRTWTFDGNGKPIGANNNSSKGLGDTVSKVIKKVSRGKVKECAPCAKRREKLNKMFPYKNNKEG